MQRIKRYFGIIKLPALAISSLFAVLFVFTPSASAAVIEVGTVVQRSDGTISVDWKDRTGSKQWVQTVLQKQADGNYSQTVQIGNDQVTLYTKPAASEKSIMVGATSTGTIGVWEGAGYPEMAYATVVSQEVYDQMKPYIEQGMSEQQAIAAVEEEQARQEAQKALDAKKNPTNDSSTTGPGGNSAEGGGECGVKNGTNLIKCDPKDNAMQSMILQFTNAFFAGVGILCVFGIVMGGIIYITAGGDASRTKQGITYIVNAVIGLVIFIFLFMLLNFMVPGGFFNNAGFEPADPPVNIDNTDPEDNQICTGPSCYSPY